MSLNNLVEILNKQKLVDGMVHSQAMPKQDVVATLLHKQHEVELLKFIAKHDLPFPLIADTDLVIHEKYGVWAEKKFMGKVYDGLHRISFLIGQDGNIEKVFDSFKTKDHHQVVLDYLG